MLRANRRWTSTASTLVGLTLVSGLLAGCSPEPQPTRNDADSCELRGGGTPVTPSAGAAGPDGAPEIATGYRSGMVPVTTATYAVSTANPVATQAACSVLRSGGTAADALVTAQTVLGLVEPQSSGLGGGAFLLYWDREAGTLDAYDGRETAPASATGDYLRWVDDGNRTAPLPDARASGRSIGVPGVPKLLESMHDEHGQQDWASLLRPAIGLADNGFTVGPRMAASIADSAADLALDPPSRDYFLQGGVTGPAAGTVLTNPAMSKTLSSLATDGSAAFYTGEIAESIVDAVADTSGGRTPGSLTAEDLSSYEVKKRTAVCAPYRDHDVCGMPGPSSGGIAVASALGILSHFDLASLGPAERNTDGGVPTAQAVHLVSEAERLAYADRDKYVADPDYIPLPGGSPEALLDPDYLRSRAELIDPNRSMGTARAGDLGPVPLGSDTGPEHGTSHLTVADKYGNVAAMTTTVESAFGSFHMAGGMVLNNQLTDFSAEPVDPSGLPLANRVAPGKRPRSSMAPTLVFDRADDGTRGDVSFATGSPGGSAIPQYVIKTLVASLDWGMDPQQAVSSPNFGASNSPTTNVGGEHPAIDAADDGARDPLVARLREMGHRVSVADQSSGSSALARTADGGWIGGADPRREGVVMGDTVTN